MEMNQGGIFDSKIFWMAALGIVALLVIMVYMFFNIVLAGDAKLVEFESLDGLTISADAYIAHDVKKTPFIVMFHQASWSRGEFLETAPRFNQMGYNCLAVDLRSGNKVRGVTNLTAERARELGKQTRFVDALQDVIAALEYVRKQYHPPAIIALGSSYSAGLVLRVAGDYPNLVDGVMAFSPAEYFVKDGFPADWVSTAARKITVPVFMTSARPEKNRWQGIFDAISTKSKLSYLPMIRGEHGSRTLWRRFPESDGYWQMIETFLKSYFHINKAMESGMNDSTVDNTMEAEASSVSLFSWEEST